MTTLAEAHNGPDASYSGGQGDWIIVTTQHRDSDVLTRSNFAAIAEDLDAEISRSGHWAVGWIEYAILEPTFSNVERVRLIDEALESYPVYDEDRFSELEQAEARESLIMCVDDAMRESDLSPDPKLIEDTVDTLMELDTTGYWGSDNAYDGNAWPKVFSADRGGEDRRTLAFSLRHARHAASRNVISVYDCPCNA